MIQGSPETEQRYAERLARYVTALRNGQPDRVPIRPFVAEFAARYAGYTCQEVTHDYEKAFAAVRRCAADFDWDAVVGNLVYVWGGLTEALGLRYYALPGIRLPPDVGFQYLEPPEAQAFMRADEYDALIADPTAFLYGVWLPRVMHQVAAPGWPAATRRSLALVKGAMALLRYFQEFGPQTARLRAECGTVSAIAGILKAPLDILADKLRGYLGLTRDLLRQPAKVRAACEALQPHLLHVALSTADPARQVPVGFWMHRGCVPFVTPAQFESHYWPTLRPILAELWARGHQTLCYAEGDWDRHLDRFAELPAGSIIYHVDRGDLAAAHRRLGAKFCLSGGIPNDLLARGSPAEVRAACRRVIDTAARDGGYILDASAIIQNDARVENLRALTDFAREYGVYSAGHAAAPAAGPPPAAGRPDAPATGRPAALAAGPSPAARPPPPPGPAVEQAAPPAPGPRACVSWEQRRTELPALTGDAGLLRRIWEDVEALGHTFIWHCLVSF